AYLSGGWMHLVIDGYGGDIDKMWGEDLVRDFLYRYPESLGMTRITEPNVLIYEAPKSEDSGVSGFVIIAESHISIHTFPRKDYINIDIFSCRPFDHERALDDVKDLFGLADVKTWLLNRGLEWLDEGQGLAEAQLQRAALEAGGSGNHHA
ncbi:MAG: S-adenosylmethionine decarboxylase, partial [Dehalococcoidia bacterium]